MAEPLVSVAVATWNGERHLEAQLDTIYAQSWPRLEVVASDDASTDGTAAILARYARERGLRHEVNRERLGLAGNFARAIALCGGDYVALADQDDLWKPQKLARLMAAIGEGTLAYGNPAETLEEDGRVHYEWIHEPVVEFARRRGTGRPVRELLAESWIVSHTMLLRRDVATAALPFPPGIVFHDGWLALVAAARGEIRFVDECLETYRRHPRSLTYQEAPPSGRRLGALVSAAFKADWRARCARETPRLEAACEVPGLTASERAFAGRLLAYYRAGLVPGWRLRSFLAGWRVAPYFSTATTPGRRLRIPFRPLLGGL